MVMPVNGTGFVNPLVTTQPFLGFGGTNAGPAIDRSGQITALNRDVVNLSTTAQTNAADLVTGSPGLDVGFQPLTALSQVSTQVGNEVIGERLDSVQDRDPFDRLAPEADRRAAVAIYEEIQSFAA